MNSKKEGPHRVLVLGDGGRVFLAVVRSLGRNGLEVHGAENNIDPVALRSRYLSKVHRLPPLDDDDWDAELIKVLQSERFELVIPVGDPAIIRSRRHRSEIEKHCPIYQLEERAFSVTNSKMLTYELARSLGVSVPESRMVDGNVDAAQLSREFGFPLMLKPVSSYTEEDLHNKRYVMKIKNEEALRLALSDARSNGPLVAQRYFEGVGVGVEVLAHHGKILTQFQHLRVHEPRDGGVSAYRKSVPVDGFLLEASKSILAALDYTGVAMLEFKVDYATGRWALLEINGRFWGSLPLAVASGMDFPYYLYQMLVEGKRDFPQGYKKSIYCRNTRLDIVWMGENISANKLRVISEASNLLLLRERNDTLALDDLRPGIHDMGLALREIMATASEKIRR